AVGIVGNLLGYNFADSIAAVIVGFMIVRMGVVFSWEAVQELIDTGLSVEDVASIRQVIIDTPGVSSLHELRTRKMAHRSLVDAHICVDPRISVSEGHRIAETTRKRVLDSQSSVADVLVHVDVEDDFEHDVRVGQVPDRNQLEKQLTPLLSGLPTPQRLVLHFLNGRVEAEVFLPMPAADKIAAVLQTEQDVRHRLAANSLVSALSLNYSRTLVANNNR
ncbi:MAG TPA: cation transporter dimerization domain-containing protein, partial [Accumulibacter sp.]|nr:cation transporter dimerization domain-containing protein [Accumulibacter sp.]